MKFDLEKLDMRASYQLMVSAVIPRPIAFVSTVDANGVFNLAPFSAFAPICFKPALVGFSVVSPRSGQQKDTLVNISSTKEYVINVVDEALAEAMNQTSAQYPADVGRVGPEIAAPIQQHHHLRMFPHALPICLPIVLQPEM